MRHLGIVALAIGLTLAGRMAQAATLEVTYTGIIEGASLTAGEFSGPETISNLIGKAFTERLTFDLSFGTIVATPGVSLQGSETLDPPIILADASSPILGSATIAIPAPVVPVSFAPFTEDLPPTAAIFGGFSSSFLYGADGAIDTVINGFQGRSSIVFNRLSGVAGPSTIDLSYLGFPRADDSAELSLTVLPTGVTISPVPLPASFALLAGGLAMLAGIGFVAKPNGRSSPCPS